MKIQRQQQGFTILETLLVSVIAGLLMIVGLRQYQSYQLNMEMERIKQNVDIVFQAMSAYYRANCFGSFNPVTQTYTYGLLNPGGQPAAANSFSINVDTALRGTAGGPKYLMDSWPLPSNILDASIGQSGYIVQFNKYTYPAYVCTAGVNATGTAASQGCVSQARVGSVVIWRPQVAVLPRSATTAISTRYLNMLGANCRSGATGSIVNRCSAAINGNYIVFERHATNATHETVSSYSPTLPSVKAFTQQYRTQNLMYLIGTQSTAAGTNINYINCSD